MNDRAKSSCKILQKATLFTYFTFDSGMSSVDPGPNSLPGPPIPMVPAWNHVVEIWDPENSLRFSMSTYVTIRNSWDGTDICNPGSVSSIAPNIGDMDDFRIYSRELNANDICTLFKS
ncbi:unnamed protein product [Adineta ricciae]|uniref:Uncharacterized protein n=1 Tax=Adineta ricciae TaxID=249248 RepID=A0A814TE85_ADIRI|nr:unnamed protein product [Adineta ricciae]